MITTPDVSVPEKTEKVITLKSNNSDGFGGGFACARFTSSNLHRVGVIFSGFKVSVVKEKMSVIDDTNFKLIRISNRKNYIIFIKILVGSKLNQYGAVFRRRNISRGNTKFQSHRI
jgi:hypothetical protein